MQPSHFDDFLFVTLYTSGRAPLLQAQEVKRLVLAKMVETKRRFNLHIAGYVLLDDHMHWLFSSPPSNEHSAIINHLRAGVQRDCRKLVGGLNTEQFWEHGVKSRLVQGKEELRNHLDFIHYDPVRHGLVQHAADYPWSSLQSRIAEGHYPNDWAVLAPPAGVAKVLGQLAEPQ